MAPEGYEPRDRNSRSSYWETGADTPHGPLGADGRRIDREWRALRLERGRRRLAELDKRLAKKCKPTDEPDQPINAT
jgi:hypothetical protein